MSRTPAPIVAPAAGQPAADVAHTQIIDTLADRLERAGWTLNGASAGPWSASRWGRSIVLHDLASLRNFADLVGAPR
ncbi:MAG: hypothetical protein RIQ60_3579 [Pseudomonadota bacterium]|jgi:hypothetical protein